MYKVYIAVEVSLIHTVVVHKMTINTIAIDAYAKKLWMLSLVLANPYKVSATVFVEPAGKSPKTTSLRTPTVTLLPSARLHTPLRIYGDLQQIGTYRTSLLQHRRHIQSI